MNKFVRILYISLLVISCIFAILFYAGGSEANGSTPLYTSSFLVWGYILAALTVFVSLVFPLFQMVKNPGNAKKSLLYVIVLVAIVGVSYIFSSGEALSFTGTGMEKFNVPSLLKRVDTGIIATYILLGIALLTLIYTEITKSFK